MKTFLILANDTGSGKTRVTGAIAGMFAAYGHAVQIVKLIETGVETGAPGDAETAAQAARETATLFGCEPVVTARTLFSFAAPLAPVIAARRENKSFSKKELLERLAGLPDDGAAFRLLETAGGLATPIDADGSDWADLSVDLAPDACVIVIEDRLGAINQARLTAAYAKSKHMPKPGFWLNAPREVENEVRAANRAHLLPLGLPLHGDTAFGDTAPRLPAGSPLTAFFTM